MSATKLFISHSARDIDLARQVTLCLERYLDFSPEAVRCTSVEGYRLDLGDDPTVIRENLESSEIVLALVTEQALESGFVLMEMGAAWGLKKRVAMILQPGLRFSDPMYGPLSLLHKVSLADERLESDLIALFALIRDKCGFSERDRTRGMVGLRQFVDYCRTSVPMAAGKPLSSRHLPTDEKERERELLRRRVGILVTTIESNHPTDTLPVSEVREYNALLARMQTLWHELESVTPLSEQAIGPRKTFGLSDVSYPTLLGHLRVIQMIASSC